MDRLTSTSTTHHADDYDIQALVDSQLGWEEEKRIWQAIERNPALHRRYDEVVAQKKLLLAWWASENDIVKPKRPTQKKEKRETLPV
jgi:hypothetical protein